MTSPQHKNVRFKCSFTVKVSTCSSKKSILNVLIQLWNLTKASKNVKSNRFTTHIPNTQHNNERNVTKPLTTRRTRDRVQTDKENWMWVKLHKSRFVNAGFKFKILFNNFNKLQSISPTKVQNNLQMFPCNPAISQRIVRTEHHNAAKKHQYMRNSTYIHCAKRKISKNENYNLSRVRIHAEWRRVSFTALKTIFSVK